MLGHCAYSALAQTGDPGEAPRRRLLSVKVHLPVGPPRRAWAGAVSCCNRVLLGCHQHKFPRTCRYRPRRNRRALQARTPWRWTVRAHSDCLKTNAVVSARIHATGRTATHLFDRCLSLEIVGNDCGRIEEAASRIHLDAFQLANERVFLAHPAIRLLPDRWREIRMAGSPSART